MDKQHKLSDLEIVQNMVDDAIEYDWFTWLSPEDGLPPLEMDDEEIIQEIIECNRSCSDPSSAEITWCGESEEFHYENIVRLTRDKFDARYWRLVGSRIANLDPSGAADYYYSKIKADFARKVATVPKPDWEPSDSEILWGLVQSDPEFWVPGCDLGENTEVLRDLPAFLYRLFDGYYWEKLVGTQHGWDGIFSWTLDRFESLPWHDHKLMRAAQENPSLSYRHWIESLGLEYVFGEDIDHRTTLDEVFGDRS